MEPIIRFFKYSGNNFCYHVCHSWLMNSYALQTLNLASELLLSFPLSGPKSAHSFIHHFLFNRYNTFQSNPSTFLCAEYIFGCVKCLKTRPYCRLSMTLLLTRFKRNRPDTEAEASSQNKSQQIIFWFQGKSTSIFA